MAELIGREVFSHNIEVMHRLEINPSFINVDEGLIEGLPDGPSI